jgi:hypothetical protein
MEWSMGYLFAEMLIPWLVVALATGFFVGWVSCGPSTSDN